MQIRWLMTGLLCLAPLIVGCGGGADGEPKDRPKRTPVSGSVTLKGSPVDGATVTFHPTSGGSAASGRTDSDGHFVLGTFAVDDGAIPTNYKVSIVKMEGGIEAAQPAPGDPGYDPYAKQPTPKHLIPEKYSNFIKSGLTADVTTTPITDLEFKLE